MGGLAKLREEPCRPGRGGTLRREHRYLPASTSMPTTSLPLRKHVAVIDDVPVPITAIFMNQFLITNERARSYFNSRVD